MTTRTVPAPRTLADALGYLTPSSSSELRRQAVQCAGQLLQPSWSGDSDALATVAFAFYTVAHQDDVAAAEVPVQRVLALLRPGGAPPGEPGLRAAAREVLHARGHALPWSAERGCWDAIGGIYQRLTFQWEPQEPMGDMPPGPSAMRRTAERLLPQLDGVSDDQVRGHASAPAPTPGRTIQVADRVATVTADSVITVRCSTCQDMYGGTVIVDGPQARYLCRERHSTEDRRLEAVRVVAALAYAEDVQMDGDAVRVRNLNVASSSMRWDFDPRSNRFVG